MTEKHECTITRRASLAGAAAMLGGCSRLSDTHTSTPTSTPTTTAEPLAQSKIQKEALEYGKEHYDVNDTGGDIGKETVLDHMKEFLENENYPEKFKDTQLSYWLDLPGNLDDPNNNVVENGKTNFEALGRDLKHFVLNNRMLGDDDWTKTGQPHIMPDGTEGIGHHYNHTKEPNWDPDAFMPRFYNEKGNIFDVEESGTKPSETTYIGPDAERGDRVGKLGENPEYAGQQNEGNFSVANYLENAEPEDLVGNPVTVCRIDWQSKGPNESDVEPSDETLEIAEQKLKTLEFNHTSSKENR